MKSIFLILILLSSLNSLAGDTITRYGFEITDDLPLLDFPTGMPSDRHLPKVLGSTASSQGYYEYLPQGYETSDQKYPLLLFIHGLGENGDGDSQLSDLLSNGIPKLIHTNQWNEELPFIVLSPQNSLGSCTRSSSIHDFINFAKETYQINPNRVYLTGLSCGAIGSWNYLGDYTNSQIAAIVPIAGNGNSAFNNAGCGLGTVPIWAFHGDSDGTVGVGGTSTPINNILACTNPAPIDTSMVIYPGVGHDSWTQTYDLSAGHDIYNWFLTKKNWDVLIPSSLELDREIQIDIGASSGASLNPWNNLTSISGAINNSINDQLVNTTVNIVISNGFNGTNQNGVGINPFGIPESVTADNFWVGSFDGHEAALLETAVVTISGLEPQATYSLELFASRTGDDGGRGRLSRYSIGTEFQDLEVADNDSNSVLFENLTGNEIINLQITVSPEGTGRFAYLGGMILRRVD
jgi:predicted esterase